MSFQLSFSFLHKDKVLHTTSQFMPSFCGSREWIQGFSDAGNCLNPSRVRLGEHHHHHILPYFSLPIPHLLGAVGKRVLEIVGRACAI